MAFSIGERVAFLNSIGEGKVIKINGDQVLVEDEDGFSDWFHLRELVSRAPLDVGEVVQKDDIGKPSRPQPGVRPNKMTVDLHFDKLVDFPKNFTSREKLEIQIREARQSVDRCRKAGIKTLILIHGVGEGRLKEEVHQLLERMDRLRFFDASLAEYGRGATEVELY